MKKYEAVLILNPNLSSKVEEFKNEFNQLLSENSFKVTKLEDIGRRQLAYSINNHNKGHYLLMNLEGDPSKLLEIETTILNFSTFNTSTFPKFQLFNFAFFNCSTFQGWRVGIFSSFHQRGHRMQQPIGA